jgi:hypothetical protein
MRTDTPARGGVPSPFHGGEDDAIASEAAIVAERSLADLHNPIPYLEDETDPSDSNFIPLTLRSSA